MFPCVKHATYTSITAYGREIKYRNTFTITDEDSGKVNIVNENGEVELYNMALSLFTDNGQEFYNKPGLAPVGSAWAAIDLANYLEVQGEKVEVEVPYRTTYIKLKSNRSPTDKEIYISSLDFYKDGVRVIPDPAWTFTQPVMPIAAPRVESAMRALSTKWNRKGRGWAHDAAYFGGTHETGKWFLGIDTNEGRPLVFDEIRYVNFSDVGSWMEDGVKDVDIICNDNPARTVYDEIQGDLIWQGEFEQHPGTQLTVETRAVTGLKGFKKELSARALQKDNAERIYSASEYAPVTAKSVKSLSMIKVSELDAEVLAPTDCPIGVPIGFYNGDKSRIKSVVISDGESFRSISSEIKEIDFNSSEVHRKATQDCIIRPSADMTETTHTVTTGAGVTSFTYHDVFGRLTGNKSIRMQLPGGRRVDVAEPSAHLKFMSDSDGAWYFHNVLTGATVKITHPIYIRNEQSTLTVVGEPNGTLFKVIVDDTDATNPQLGIKELT